MFTQLRCIVLKDIKQLSEGIQGKRDEVGREGGGGGGEKKRKQKVARSKRKRNFCPFLNNTHVLSYLMSVWEPNATPSHFVEHDCNIIIFK